MKTINITLNEENLDDLLHIIFIYESYCARNNYPAMGKAATYLREYIKQCSE